MKLDISFEFFWADKYTPIFAIKRNGKFYYLCLCHHLPDRCIWFFGLEKILCARCCGGLTGYFIGFALSIFDIMVPFYFGVAACIPLVIDGVTQNLGYRTSNNFLRLISGILFGLGMTGILYYFADLL